MAKRGSFKDSVSSSPAKELLAQAKEMPSNNDKQEVKSVRVNLLFRPTVKRNIEKLAQMKQTSINDLLNVVMAEYIEEHYSEIEKYNSVFGED